MLGFVSSYLHYFLLLKTIAAITPGIQPAQVKINVSNIAPHPLSSTANGGKIIHKIARPHPISITPNNMDFHIQHL